MKTLKYIFTGFLATVLATTDCFAVSTKCNNPFYRRTHQKQCQEVKSDTDSTTPWMTIIGGAVLAGTGIALAVKSSDGGANSAQTPNQNNFARSANAVQAYALGDYIQNKKISTSYIKSATNGSDIDTDTIESIRNSADYVKNQKHFDTIKMAWAHARGFSGKNVTINILDDFYNYHGHAVHDIIKYVAPNAAIYDNYLTNTANNFKSFDEIANIIKSSTPSHIYNNSWEIASIPTQNAATVIYNNFDTKTYANAQQYLYSSTSYNFITQMINLATDNDSIFVWAAGNEHQNESGILSAIPLAFPELQGHFVNVVALDTKTNKLASYSNQCGITQNYCITAPGSHIQTDAIQSKVSGTSFATPIVSAAIAVIKETFPYLTANQITAILFTTAQDLGKPGVDEIYGWGVLDLEAATNPVGTPTIILSNDNIIPLTTSTISGLGSMAVQNAGIKFAFFDAFGRAFTTSLSDNIKIIPYGRAFEKLQENNDNFVTIFDNFEFGFKKANILESNGLLNTQSNNLTNFIGLKNKFNFGNFNLYYKTRLGISNPEPESDSIISKFSTVQTASIKTGIKWKDLNMEFAIPETIIYGNAYMYLPIARANNGQIIYNNYKIDLTTKPSLEYSLKYKNISVGYIDNTGYQDEFFIIAKTKMIF